MTNRPRHPKPDGNQSTIVSELRANGFVVHDVSSLGGDALDLFVGGYNQHSDINEWTQVEVKTDDGVLTEGEARYIESVGLTGLPVIVARCAEDVLKWYGWI